MDSMEFLFCFGTLQAKRGGATTYVTPKNIKLASGLPPSTIYYHLNKLMDMQYIVREGRGQYAIVYNEHTASLAVSVLTSMDMYLYQVDRENWLSQFEVKTS